MARSRTRVRRRRGIRALTVGLVLAGLVAVGYGYYRYSQTNDAPASFEQAKKHFAAGRFRAAAIESKNALKINPDYLDARWLLALTYLELGDGLSASKELAASETLGKEGIELDRAVLKALLLQRRFKEVLGHLATQTTQTEDNELRLIRGQARLGLGEYEKAKQQFETVLAEDADNVVARRGLSAAALGLEDTKQASQQITIALAGTPEDVESWVLKGETDLLQGAIADAVAAYSEALEREPEHLLARIGITRALLLDNKPDAALEHVQYLQAANPNNPVGNYLLALVSRQRNDAAATRLALLDVLKISPNHPASLLLMGSLHYSSDELEQAKDLLSRYMSLQPEDVRGAKLLAAVLLKQKNFPDAIELLEQIAPSAPNDAQLTALLGAAHMANKQFDKAHEYMSKAAELAPDAAAIRTQLAVSHLFAGDTDEGVRELEAAVELDPEFARADYLLVILHLREKRFDEALKTAAKLAESQPDNPIPVNLMGASHEGLGQIDAARASYERAIQIQPIYATARLNLARLDVAAGEHESASSHYRAALEHNESNLHALVALAQLREASGDRREAIELLSRARAAHPKAHTPRLVLARHFLSVGDATNAASTSAEALALAPKDPATLLVTGQVAVALGQFEKSRELFEELARLAPDQAIHQYYLGVARSNSGDVDGGRTAFERTLELEPGHVSARSALGRLMLSEGNVDGARQVAVSIQQSAPQSADGYLLEGDAMVAARDLEAARTAFESAQARQPSRQTLMKLVAVHRSLGTPEVAFELLSGWLGEHPNDQPTRVTLASLHQSDNNDVAAARLYEESLKAEPDNVIALNNLAWIYHKRGDQRALETARKAHLLLPDRAEIADTYGWFLVEGGNVEQGLALLTRAVEGAPDNLDIRYHLAAGLSRAGETARARSELESILASDAEFSLRAEAQALLTELP